MEAASLSQSFFRILYDAQRVDPEKVDFKGPCDKYCVLEGFGKLVNGYALKEAFKIGFGQPQDLYFAL
jgi:hypothetical protein